MEYEKDIVLLRSYNETAGKAGTEEAGPSLTYGEICLLLKGGSPRLDFDLKGLLHKDKAALERITVLHRSILADHNTLVLLRTGYLAYVYQTRKIPTRPSIKLWTSLPDKDKRGTRLRWFGQGYRQEKFLQEFRKGCGVAAIAAGGLTVKPAAAEAFFFGPKIDPRWKGLVSNLKEYVTRTLRQFDMGKARAALEGLAPYGITEADLVPLQKVNRCLLPKNMFLTYYYMNSASSIPSVKLFNISSQDIFDGYVVDGVRRTTLFGRKLDTYRRVLLGEEIFSTVDVPPVAMPYNLAAPGSARPEWVIAIPYEWIHNLYGRRAGGIEERLVEELTVHEITHIVHQTREELLPFLPVRVQDGG
jgi:hypothetical protein